MRSIQKPLPLVAVAVFCLASAATARAEDFPKGTFTLKGPMEITLSINFDGKGKLTVKRDDEELLTADYKATKDEIEFSNEGGAKGDKDAKPGKYKWKLDGKKLTFTKIQDDSNGRSQALTHGAWEKKD